LQSDNTRIREENEALRDVIRNLRDQLDQPSKARRRAATALTDWNMTAMPHGNILFRGNSTYAPRNQPSLRRESSARTELLPQDQPLRSMARGQFLQDHSTSLPGRVDPSLLLPSTDALRYWSQQAGPNPTTSDLIQNRLLHRQPKWQSAAANSGNTRSISEQYNQSRISTEGALAHLSSILQPSQSTLFQDYNLNRSLSAAVLQGLNNDASLGPSLQDREASIALSSTTPFSSAAASHNTQRSHEIRQLLQMARNVSTGLDNYSTLGANRSAIAAGLRNLGGQGVDVQPGRSLARSQSSSGSPFLFPTLDSGVDGRFLPQINPMSTPGAGANVNTAASLIPPISPQRATAESLLERQLLLEQLIASSTPSSVLARRGVTSFLASSQHSGNPSRTEQKAKNQAPGDDRTSSRNLKNS